MKKVFFLISFVVLTSTVNAQDQHSQSINPLQKLIDGNERFIKGKSIHPDESMSRVQEIKSAQHPFAIVVSCSDSRVSPEIVFDQGLGDIFSIRTAGNVIGDLELGSIEYAVEHLHCNLIVVLGHENCGAIKAFLEDNGEKHNDHIGKILEYLNDEKEEQEAGVKVNHNVPLAVQANVKHGVTLLEHSKPILEESVEHKQLKIVGALYDLSTGKVTFNH